MGSLDGDRVGLGLGRGEAVVSVTRAGFLAALVGAPLAALLGRKAEPEPVPDDVSMGGLCEPPGETTTYNDGQTVTVTWAWTGGGDTAETVWYTSP